MFVRVPELNLSFRPPALVQDAHNENAGLGFSEIDHVASAREPEIAAP
jgi:hypothetical protein